MQDKNTKMDLDEMRLVIYQNGMSALRTQRRKIGLSQSDLALLVGTTQPQIMRLENGDRKFTKEWAERIAPHLNVTAQELLFEDILPQDSESLAGVVNQNTEITNQLIDKPKQSNPKLDKTNGAYLTPADHIPIAGSRLARDVPVLGVAVGGEDADFSFNGDTIDQVRRPPGIAGQKGVYALYVVGTSMSPKFEEGDLIYVSTTRPPSIGDCVVIELYPESDDKPGKGFVKRLKSRNSAKVICDQFKPPKEITFNRERVKSIHRVIPWNELLGV